MIRTIPDEIKKKQDAKLQALLIREIDWYEWPALAMVIATVRTRSRLVATCVDNRGTFQAIVGV